LGELGENLSENLGVLIGPFISHSSHLSTKDVCHLLYSTLQ
jgi:hypothetical protein